MALRFTFICAAIVASLTTSAFGREIDLRALPGMEMRAPRVEAEGASIRVSGIVCRGGFTAGRPRFVRLDRLSDAGDVTDTRWGAMRATPGYRGGCGSYALTVEPAYLAGRVRLSAVRTR